MCEMCDNCYHKTLYQNYVGAIFADRIKNVQAVKCPFFNNKDLVVSLPCKVGGTLYSISARVDGKSHIRRLRLALALTNQNMGNVLSRIGQDIYSNLENAETHLRDIIREVGIADE